jgi:predicted ribosomally synthesized peptide with nif11-like leader
MNGQEKVNELLRDAEFVGKIKEMDSLEEIAAAFSERGIEVTADELKAAAELSENGELPADALDNVSGGSLTAGLAIWMGLTVAGVYIGWKAGRRAAGC